jgi:hypothetical protein
LERPGEVDLQPYTVSIARGDGLVARTSDAVMYIADSTPTADQLLAALDQTAGPGTRGPSIADRLASIAFSEDPAHISTFGVITSTAHQVRMILRGKIIAEVEGSEGVRNWSGNRALSWVDEVLPDSLRRVAVTVASGTRFVAHPHTNLRAGVVPGGGFVLIHPRVSVEEVYTQKIARSTPTPPEEQPTQRAHSSALRVPVETSTLSFAGAVLIADDGAAYPLDRTYVIGRSPLGDNAVRNATASPIMFRDDQHVSRVHAYVSIDGGAVFVRDAATRGGTFIAPPKAKEWIQIGTTPTELQPGWSIRVGKRILTYQQA